MRTHRQLTTAAAALAVVLVTGPAFALGNARQGFGLGIGSATIANGLSFKGMTGPGAVQAVAGFWGGGGAKHRFGEAHGLALGADYLFEMPSLARSRWFSLDWSVGLGAGVGVARFDDRAGRAGSGVAGLEFNFTTIPLDLTVEYRPTLRILHDVGLDLVDFTAHLRLWF